MPFPWREHRCWCGKIGVINFQGEMYCSWHLPFKEMSEEYTLDLIDLIGVDTKNELIDGFQWEEYYYWVKNMVDNLNMPTGLLSFDP